MVTSARAADPIVLFDLDGTITDSAPGVIGSFLHALARYDVPAPDGDLRSRLVGPPMAATMTSLGLAPALEAALLAAYHEHYSSQGWRDTTVFTGMPELLSDLHADGVRLAVATSKQEVTARRILAEHGLADRFELIAGADGERHAKADVIDHALAELGITPGAARPRMVLAGDRSHDLQGAAAHGIPVAFVSWGYGTAAESEGAAWVLDSPAQLAEVLTRYLAAPQDAAEGSGHDDGGGHDDGRLHVTFVCTGNICRSPMAEKIVGEHLRRAGLADAVRVTSAGTGDWHVGAPADPRARAELRSHGYPDAHAAAQMGPAHLSADLVVALDSGHRRAILAAGTGPERVRLLRSFDPDADGQDVADPYYGATEGFTTVRRQIEAAAPGIADWVRARVRGAGDPR